MKNELVVLIDTCSDILRETKIALKRKDRGSLTKLPFLVLYMTKYSIRLLLTSELV